MATQSKATATVITRLIHNSLECISDHANLSRITSSLVTPRLTSCGHAFPSKGEPISCWVVSELEQTKLGLITCVYSEQIVAGTDNKWGYANMDQSYFLGKAAWCRDFGLAVLEWPLYRDHWFQPKKEVVGGSEFDWYAYDSQGNIALFSSAGYGEVPEMVFSESYAYAILDAYFGLERAKMRISPEEWGTPDVFKKYSDRGLFVFDWQHWDGPYKKKEEPDSPLNIKSIDECVREVLTMVGFESIDFSLETKVYPGARFQCWKPTP